MKQIKHYAKVLLLTVTLVACGGPTGEELAAEYSRLEDPKQILPNPSVNQEDNSDIDQSDDDVDSTNVLALQLVVDSLWVDNSLTVRINHPDWSEPRVVSLTSGAGNGQTEFHDLSTSAGLEGLTVEVVNQPGGLQGDCRVDESNVLGDVVSLNIKCPELVAIELEGGASQLAVGYSSQIVAKAQFSNGEEKDFGSELDWQLNGDSVSTDSAQNSLTITALSDGSSTLTASFAGLKASRTIVSQTKVFDQLVISEANIVSTVGVTKTIQAFARFTDGTQQVLENTGSWQSSDTDVATVNHGEIEFRAPGTAEISYTFDSSTATSQVSVTGAELVGLSITPPNTSLIVGQSLSYTATALFDDQTTQNVTDSVSWSISDNSVGSINFNDVSGDLRALSAGSAIVTASFGNQQAQAQIAVEAISLQSIVVSFNDITVPVGTQAQATAIGHYSDLSTLDLTSSVVWSSDAQGLVSMSSQVDGQITTVAAGQATITASLDGIQGSSNLTVSASTLSSLEVTPKGILVAKSIDTQLTVMGTYSGGEVVDITDLVTWSSDNASSAYVEGAGLMKNIHTGTSVATVTITASLGLISGSISPKVSGAMLQNIAVLPGTPSININDDLQLEVWGFYDDLTSVNLTEHASISSDDTVVVVVGAGANDKGRLYPLSVGSAEVTASFSGVSGSTTISVVNGATESTKTGTGLIADYFSTMNLNPNDLHGRRVDSQVDFNLGTGESSMGLDEQYSVRWQGEFTVPSTGDYIFTTNSDDGIRLYIDDLNAAPTINDWSNHGAQLDDSGVFSLVEGTRYKIVLEFYENSGHAVTQLFWRDAAQPQTNRTLIPTEHLYPVQVLP